jgi:D-alanine-D-alanine ligase
LGLVVEGHTRLEKGAADSKAGSRRPRVRRPLWTGIDDDLQTAKTIAMPTASGGRRMRGVASRSLSVGLVFETFDTYPTRPGAPPDAHVEYEPLATIEVLEQALASLGHTPLRVGSPVALLEGIGRKSLPRLDVALNIAEGHGSRNREAWAPVLLEMAGVPCLGSDALTLSCTLDKAWANRAAAAAGIRVAAQCVMATAADAAHVELPAGFPLFVKPRWEGTAKGIRRSSLVHSRRALAGEVERIARDYAQPALVEAFVPGAEYTVTIVGHDPPRVLPIIQRALEAETRIGLHALESATDRDADRLAYCVPGDLSRDLEARLAKLALDVFALFECRDFARADFRLDAAGEPIFLEINPLPTFAPDATFGILAELAGRPLSELLAEVLREGLIRLGLPGEGPDASFAAPPVEPIR